MGDILSIRICQNESRLTGNPTDVKAKVEAATQLRDNLEHYVSGQMYPVFLKKLIPIFINCLKGPPVFISTSPEQVRTSQSGRSQRTDLV